MQQFDFYWRMEPDVHYYCDLDYDPFLFMQVTLFPMFVPECSAASKDPTDNQCWVFALILCNDFLF